MVTNTQNHNTGKTLVFIDQGVEDYQYLQQGVISTAEAHIINQSGDGIEQISQVLGQYQNIAEVHIISHGSPGCLYLGNGQLSLNSLNSYASQLQQWNIKSLLLYGCYVAAGDAGAEFVEKLHDLTGAEIAASKSLTGSAIQGGNWQLEYQTGEQKKSLALLEATVNNYAGVLTVSLLKADISPSWLTNVNGTLYFQASDATNGIELWKSDGTTNGTVLVKDISPGSGWSFPEYLTNVNGTLYFQAYDPINGTELWKSDGTAAGTVLVKDIWSGAASSSPSNLTNVNGTLYFQAYDPINGYELWKSDGTAAGTVLVKDISLGDSSVPSNLTNVNGTLYFQAYDPINGYELWKSDGTAAGTVLVKDISLGASSYPSNLTNVNGTLYFRANDPTNGYELWKSDGTAAGTVLVKDIWSGAASSSPSNLTNVNGTLYFTADDGTSGNELWKSDGTAAGTVLVKDISLGASSSPWQLTNVNGTLYFQAYDPINGFELWKSDGTAAGTVLVKDISLGASSVPSNLTNVNGTLYFTAEADDPINGVELWKSDGTETGTVLVQDIAPGIGNSYPSSLTNVNGTLYFTANDGVGSNDLFKVSGNSSPTDLSLSSTNINENVTANSTVGTFTSTDPDTGNTFTYSLVTGTGSTDNSAFNINAGQLRINNSPNFEAKSSYSVRVRTTDQGGLFFEKPLTININNVNEQPTDFAISNSSINENVTANSTVGTFTSTDPDTGNTFTYSLVAGTGDTDNSAFNINAGQLRINNSPNFEAKSSYSVRVRTTDQNNLSFEKPLTININNVNEQPTDLAISNNSINENVAVNTVVGNFTSTDPDTGNTFTYSLVAGTGDTHNSAFSITSGQLKINASPDFETQSIYNIRVRTTDQNGLFYDKPLTININNLNDLTPNDDLWQGSATADQVDGRAGNDRLYGNAGNDTIDGGDGDDLIYGGNDNDLLRGGNGIDRLYGDAGNDSIMGDAGNDILYGGTGNDTLNGGAGGDRLYGDGGSDTFVLETGMGQDTIYQFLSGTDKIMIKGVSGFAGLSFTPSGSNTLIKVLATGETLGILSSVTTYSANDFVFDVA